MKNKIKEKFLKYVSFDTQSDESLVIDDKQPSTDKQLDLANALFLELKEYNLDDLVIDNYGYVYGYLKGSIDTSLTIGLIAHLDTASELSGKNVKPQIFENYNGEPLICIIILSYLKSFFLV